MSYDNHSLLGFSTVQGGGVVSSTTGTSIQLSSSSGFSSGANQNITVWPSGVDPTTSNAEIMRVTNNNTQNNTLTVTRAQEGSTALGNIAVGYQVANTITPKVLTDIEAQGYLGYAQITSPISTASTSFTAATGLTTTVTVPATGRNVKVTFYGDMQASLALSSYYFAIYKDGTCVQDGIVNETTAGFNMPVTCIYIDQAPTSGSHTYAIYFAASAGTAYIYAGTGGVAGTFGPAFILAEAI